MPNHPCNINSLRTHYLPLFLAFILFWLPIPNLSAEQLNLASTNTLLTSLITLAQDQGLYKEAGIELVLTPKETGELAIRSLLEQRADIAVVATAPFVKHALKNSNLQLIASFGHSDNEIKIAARRDHGISGPYDLRGRRIGTQPGIAFRLFLNRLLAKHGMSEDDITPIFMPASRLPAALSNGLIDAMSFSGPELRQSMELQEDNLLIISEPGMYTKSFNLVTTDEFLQTTGAKTLIPFLQALKEAERRMPHQPDEMTELLSKQLEQPTESVRIKLSDVQLKLSMDNQL